MRSVALAMALLVVPARAETGRATRFAYKGDRHVGGVSRCLGRVPNHTDWGIAIRGGKCGHLYRVTNLRTGRSVVAPKIDSGPYGALVEGTWVIKRRHSDPGVWRGIADLTPPVAEALGHRSFDLVKLERIP